MSYDVYCYQPQSDAPDAKEAGALIQSEEGAVRRDDDEARGIKRKIADALLKYNPRLEPFKIDHSEVAKLMKITLEQAKAQWNHIELNPPKGDLRIQLTIHWDHVCLTIPYWYTGAKADEVFQQLSAYLRVIRAAAGFFAYDPQTNRAFDPEKEEFGEHSEYGKAGTVALPEILQVMDKPPGRFYDGDALIRVLVEAAGKDSGRQLHARLKQDVIYWETVGPTLTQDWLGQLIAVGSPLFVKFNETSLLVRELDKEHYAHAAQTVAELRSFWTSQPQLYDPKWGERDLRNGGTALEEIRAESFALAKQCDDFVKHSRPEKKSLVTPNDE